MPLKDSLPALCARFQMLRFVAKFPNFLDIHIYFLWQDFPQYVVNFVRRFITGSYASPISSATPKSNNSTEGIARDTFGFRQVIVAATAFGKVFGIDSSNGEIVWSRVLGLGWADAVGGRIQPVKLFVTRTVSDGGDPEVVLVTQRHADNVYSLTFLCLLPSIDNFLSGPGRHRGVPY